MRYLILAALIAPGYVLLAQNPGQHVQVDVAIESIGVTADTTSISYQVANLMTSTEPLWVFYVDIPGGVLSMAASTGPLRWRTGTVFGDLPMAGWMFRHGYLAPGATTPELRFQAIGLPGLRTFWAGGYFPLPPAQEDVVTESTVLPDPFVTEMINDRTVGVDPWPANRSAQALLLRLRALTESSCAAPLVWITDSNLCSQLVTELDQVETYRANGQSAQAVDALANYQALVSSGSSTGAVKNPAYWLLRSNAEIVRTIL